jgi:small subunit ribosomal protein S13
MTDLKCMRVSGVTIPKEKRIVVSLTYIYGIGPTTAKKILSLANVKQSIRTKDLTQEQEDLLRNIIEKQHKTEGDLRREVSSNIKRLKDIKSYRGVRHARRLPVRGQRTKTNSRTVRGNKRNVATSGKKPAAQKT